MFICGLISVQPTDTPPFGNRLANLIRLDWNTGKNSGKYSREDTLKYLEKWTSENLSADQREKFAEVAEDEILPLHEGNFARYKIRPSEFEEWQKIWHR